MVSGTHGVEGFCGSGCQVALLADGFVEARPSGCAVVLLHALNPYGFAWLRRVNEDGVDLNRNFQDFSQPLPDSSAYEELHDALVPREWDGLVRAEADRALAEYVAKRDMRAYQAAVSTGQYTRPTGLFCGGASARGPRGTCCTRCVSSCRPRSRASPCSTCTPASGRAVTASRSRSGSRRTPRGHAHGAARK